MDFHNQYAYNDALIQKMKVLYILKSTHGMIPLLILTALVQFPVALASREASDFLFVGLLFVCAVISFLCQKRIAEAGCERMFTTDRETAHAEVEIDTDREVPIISFAVKDPDATIGKNLYDRSEFLSECTNVLHDSHFYLFAFGTNTTWFPVSLEGFDKPEIKKEFIKFVNKQRPSMQGNPFDPMYRIMSALLGVYAVYSFLTNVLSIIF